MKASCHINGLVIVTAIRSGGQNNHVKILRTCVMPQDQTHDIDVCMSVWQDLLFFAHITFTLHKDLAFSESQVTWSVDWKCCTNNVSTRIPRNSGLSHELRERKLMLLWRQLMVTCFMILVIKLVHCMSAALQTVLTLSYCGCQTTSRDILDTKKVLLFCHTSWLVSSWMTVHCIHAAFKINP